MKPSAAARTIWQNPADGRPVCVDIETAFRDDGVLTDDVLFQICGLSADDPQVTPEWLSRTRLVTRLLAEPRLCQHTRLEAALTLLASALGQLTQFNLTHLPFGYDGPDVQSRGWMERRALERVGKQIVGLMWRHTSAETVAVAVELAVSEGIRLGFLEQRQYDSWRPGMRSGSGWRWAVTATPYGVARANWLAENANGQAPIAGAPPPATNASNSNGQRVGESNVSAPHAGTTAPQEHRGPTLALEATPAKDGQNQATSSASSDDRYEWARQIDLVRATNQVLGEGMLNKGVLSRACADGQVETNGTTGRGARVRLRSFLVWISRQNQLGAEETNQIRNAVIGEISARNS